jgi:hypothetical protein
MAPDIKSFEMAKGEAESCLASPTTSPSLSPTGFDLSAFQGAAGNLAIQRAASTSEMSTSTNTIAPWFGQRVEYMDDKGVCRVVPAFDPFALQKSQDDLWRGTIGEESTAFNRIAHVCVPKGVRVRTKPNVSSDDLGIIPFDTLVRIDRRTMHGWCYITVLPQQIGPGTSEIVGATGFVEGRFLLLDPPDANSFLHYVQPGEGAANVAAMYYKPPEGFSSGYDAYLFVSALWEVNKGPLQTGEGTYTSAMFEKPISLSWRKTWIRFEAEEESMKIYLGARLRAAHALWIPSLEKVMELKTKGVIESATIWGSQGEDAGFLRGVFDGLIDGFTDLAKDAKKLAEFLWDVMEGKFIDRLIEFAKKIGKLIANFDLDKAIGAGKEMLKDFVEKWSQPDPFLRGHYQGHLVGYLVVLVLPMVLTGGAAALARFPRAAAILNALSKVVNPVELLGDMAESMRASGVADKLLASGEDMLTREGIIAERFPGGRKAIEEHFDPILDEAFPEHDPWGGFVFEREKSTMFRADERRINFQMDRSMSKFSVAEEVQHALDYTLGAQSEKQILAEARRLGIPDEKVVNWWHRRVFTRMLKNIHEEKFGLGYLKPYIQEVYERGYRAIGGKLSLETILSTTWEGLF